MPQNFRLKILLVEDDVGISQPLVEFLLGHFCHVTHVDTIEKAEGYRATYFDTVLLDWMLPDGDGLRWLKAARGNGCKWPVIMLTAKSDVTDKVLGFELGANDYVTKPFEPRELLARIQAHVRTATDREFGKKDGKLLETSGLSIDLETLEVSYAGESLNLTQMEFKLLRFFVEHPRLALSRDTLLNKVWGLRYPTTRTVDTHVMQLRQKTKASLFETLHGLGYRFVPDADCP